MNLDELFELYHAAWSKVARTPGGARDEAHRAGIAAVVMALRDEICPPSPLQDETWVVKWPTESLTALFNNILGSDAEGKAAGASARKDEGALVSAPSTPAATTYANPTVGQRLIKAAHEAAAIARGEDTGGAFTGLMDGLSKAVTPAAPLPRGPKETT